MTLLTPSLLTERSDSSAVAGSAARQLSQAEFNLLREAGERRSLAPGELIFRRGELGRTMFAIESGAVLLEFGDGLRDKRIAEREFFGELALFIGDHARLASALAGEDTVLYVVDHAAIDALLEREPALMARFMRRSFAYLVASEQKLILSLTRRNEELLLTLDSLRQTRTQLNTAERLVQTDELTGLCNRRGLYAYLDGATPLPARGLQLALLLVDLDNFKQINDCHGHIAGDRVLEAVAEQLRQVAAHGDMPCRLGGDEFALLVQVTGMEELDVRARQLCERVRKLALPVPLGPNGVSVSIGGVLCDGELGWSSWYSEADRALYRVKGEGGDHHRIAITCG